jgi:hypothetical protein
MTEVKSAAHYLLLIVVLAMFSIASCGAPAPSGNDMLTGLMNAQDQATAAARQYTDVSAHATTIAQATREYLVLQGQQTRIADQSRASQTTFAESVRATQAAGAATATARSVLATSTREAEQANATATTRAANYTATSAAVIVQSTLTSASATSTANAANALATRVSGDATATVIAAGVTTQLERERWTRTTEGAWSVFRIVVMALVVIIVCLFLYRAIQVFVLRRRGFRDANNELVLILPGNDGQEHVTRPGRMSGPVLQMTPPKAQPYQVDAPAADPETTKRDQAISLMRAATAGNGKGSSGDDLADAIMDDPRVQIVDEPPAQLVGGNVMPLLEARWKEVNDDAE